MENYLFSFPEDMSNPLNLLPSRHGRGAAGSSGNGRLKSWSLDGPDPAAEPSLMFKSTNTKSRQIRSSIEKLEKVQDDLFQL